jgi:hypothetical protein
MGRLTKEANLPFKSCSCCEHRWETRDDLLEDTDVQLVGYQADFADLDRGLLLFTHLTRDCGSTMALEVGEMIDLIDTPRHARTLRGTDDCRGHCLSVRNLGRCNAPCRNAHVRDLMHEILERQVRRDS